MYSSGKPFGFWSAVLLGVGAMVGAGIFALMGQAGSVAGAAVWQSFLYGGLVAALSGYSFGRLGARYPSAGGLVEYLVRGFGDSYFAGTAAVLLYVSGLLALALIAKAFGSYACALVLGETSRWVVDAFALGVVGLLTWINLNGPGEVSRIENAFVVSKVVVLVAFVAIGMAYVQPDRLAPANYPDQLHVAASIGFTFFAFEGFRVITNTAEDMPHPTVQLPRAMLTAIVLVAVLYVLMSVVVFGNLDVAQVIAARDYALAEAAAPVFGTAGFVVVGIVAMISTASAINANLYAVTNVTYQMARYGELPQAFRRPIAHSREGLLISAGTVAALVPTFDLASLAVAGSVTILLVHVAVHAGHWRLTRETRAARPLIALALVANAGVVLTVVGFQLAHHPQSLLYLGGFVLLAVLLETVLRSVTGRELRSRPRWGHHRSGRSQLPADNESHQGAGENGMAEAAPFTLQRLDHLVLRTHDVDRLVAFYRALGCTVVREVARMRMVQLAAGASMIDIVGVDTQEPGRNLDHFALRIEPFDEERIRRFCAERGIEIETPEQLLLGADGFGPGVYLRDPDGNRVELKGPPERPRPRPDEDAS